MAHFRESISYLRELRYVIAVYKYIFGRRMNPIHPRRYTEKLHVFKISKVAESLAPYVDKYAVRPYVAQVIGEEHLIPLLGVYETVEEVDLADLPSEFMLKATHGSGWNIFCPDKKKLDWPEAMEKLHGWLGTNFYELYHERQYKNIPPRLIAEKMLHEHEDGLTEYKIHCYAGKAQTIRAQAGRLGKIRKSFYDLDWNQLPFNYLHKPPTPPAPVGKPERLNEMILLAEKLAAPFPYVRVDLYNIKGKIYFSELTFSPNNGQDVFDPDFYDLKYGKMIDLGAWKQFSPKIPLYTEQNTNK